MARAALLPLRPSLASQLRDYADLHPSRVSLAAAAAASILVPFGLLAMVSWITVGVIAGHPLHLGYAVFAFALLHYARLDFALTSFLAPLFALSFPFAAICPRVVIVASAVVGGVLYVGMLVARAPRPTFVKTLQDSVIGPLFFAALLLGLWPMRKATLAL